MERFRFLVNLDENCKKALTQQEFDQLGDSMEQTFRQLESAWDEEEEKRKERERVVALKEKKD